MKLGLQTNDGDVFKLTMDLVEDNQGKPTGEVGSLKLKFFDTIPVAKSLCIMKSGFQRIRVSFTLVFKPL